MLDNRRVVSIDKLAWCTKNLLEVDPATVCGSIQGRFFSRNEDPYGKKTRAREIGHAQSRYSVGGRYGDGCDWGASLRRSRFRQPNRQPIADSARAGGRFDGSRGSSILRRRPQERCFGPSHEFPAFNLGRSAQFRWGCGDLGALLYPHATTAERNQVLEGLTFFTTPHTAAEGLGPISNQVFCLGCHENTAEGVRTPRSASLLTADLCSSGSTCVSHVTRAARATPTNFAFTSLNPVTGGGRPAGCNSNLDSEACPQPTDSGNLDALHNTGKTAAFTVFGDFNPSHYGRGHKPNRHRLLRSTRRQHDKSDHQYQGRSRSAGLFSIPGRRSRHAHRTRSHLSTSITNLVPSGPVDPKTGLYPSGFRRAVGELAGPPYIGRGLIEAVPTTDITAMADPGGTQIHNSSLGNFTATAWL